MSVIIPRSLHYFCCKIKLAICWSNKWSVISYCVKTNQHFYIIYYQGNLPNLRILIFNTWTRWHFKLQKRGEKLCNYRSNNSVSSKCISSCKTVYYNFRLKFFFQPVILLPLTAILRLPIWIKAFTFTISNTNDPVLSSPEKPFENPSRKTMKFKFSEKPIARCFGFFLSIL